MSALFERLRRDRRGVAAVEFAMISLVMFLMILGAQDLLHREYVQDVLDGEMQRVARDSTLEGASLKLNEIDGRMRRAVRRVASEAVITVERDTYPTFLAIKPERFDDANGNGKRDAGECFDDINGNRAWDVKPGRSGQGGANDVTVIRATVTFPHLFPMARMFGAGPKQVLASETVLKNQPFDAQTVMTPVPICN